MKKFFDKKNIFNFLDHKSSLVGRIAHEIVIRHKLNV